MGFASRLSKREKRKRTKKCFLGDSRFASTGNRTEVSNGPSFPFNVDNFSNDNASITGRFKMAGLSKFRSVQKSANEDERQSGMLLSINPREERSL